MKVNLDELKTRIEPAPAPEPELLPRVPLWKKIVLAASVLLPYLALTLGFIFSNGGSKLVFIIFMIAYIPASKLVIKLAKKFLKYPDIST